MIFSMHFNDAYSHKVSLYWYEDRYRYTVTTDKGIEYRETAILPHPVKNDTPETRNRLMWFIQNDIMKHPYGDVQYNSKCIRCSKSHAAPRKEFNLAPLCNRCAAAMSDISNTAGNTEYFINEDGSKGSVVKE